MPPWRRRLFTRGHAVAWLVSLALGIGWVEVLLALPSDYDPVVTLFLALVGIFGSIFGLLTATGLLVGALSFFGSRPGYGSRPGGEVGPDVVFGICVLLFTLPSLFVYYGA